MTDAISYTCYAVFTRRAPVPVDVAADVTELIGELAELGVTTRGLYDVHGMPAKADLLVWLHGDSAERLQEAQRRFQREALGGAVELTWSGFGVHRQAEFSREHVPAFLRGAEPKTWLTVYPFVRSYEWYLLPDDQRREMLLEHGKKGRQYPQVNANTVAAFALGDYEWLLAFEADELTDLVDMMRDLRYTEARRHVREELPFYTGRRITTAQLAVLLA